VYDSGRDRATAALRRRSPLRRSGRRSGRLAVRCWESLRCSFTLSSLSPSNSRERPGAVNRAVAIASASQILVTAHLRCGQGIGAGLVCARS
jgi:hypothetical protein